jgi:competence protein ComEC
LRIVALAVTALVLVDPLLVHSVGFQLSVGASVGLVVLAAPLAVRLPGPRWLAEPMAVTVAAQIGVAPVLLATFGGMPAVTVFANLLAVPVAAPLTAWGMTAGLVAGVVGGAPAALLHVPTNAMVAWISWVATTCARLPIGLLGAAQLAAVAALILGLFTLQRRRVWAALGCGAIVLVLLVAVGQNPPPSLRVDDLASGAHLWRAGANVLVLDGETDAGRVLDGLRAANVRRLDLVIARRGTVGVAGTILDLRRRVTVRQVAAPAGHSIRDASAVDGPVSIGVGRLAVQLVPRGAVLDVQIGETAPDAGAARGRGP